MAVPKGKTSKQRKHARAANWKAAAPTLVECPQCHELKVPHKVCDAWLLRRTTSCRSFQRIQITKSFLKADLVGSAFCICETIVEFVKQ